MDRTNTVIVVEPTYLGIESRHAVKDGAMVRTDTRICKERLPKRKRFDLKVYYEQFMKNSYHD